MAVSFVCSKCGARMATEDSVASLKCPVCRVAMEPEEAGPTAPIPSVSEGPGPAGSPDADDTVFAPPPAEVLRTGSDSERPAPKRVVPGLKVARAVPLLGDAPATGHMGGSASVPDAAETQPGVVVAPGNGAGEAPGARLAREMEQMIAAAREQATKEAELIEQTARLRAEENGRGILDKAKSEADQLSQRVQTDAQESARTEAAEIRKRARAEAAEVLAEARRRAQAEIESMREETQQKLLKEAQKLAAETRAKIDAEAKETRRKAQEDAKKAEAALLEQATALAVKAKTEAEKEAGQIIAKAQDEAKRKAETLHKEVQQRLLTEAENMAKDARAQAETDVQAMRDQAKQDAEKMLADANKSAEKEAEEIRAKARREADEIRSKPSAEAEGSAEQARDKAADASAGETGVAPADAAEEEPAVMGDGKAHLTKRKAEIAQQAKREARRIIVNASASLVGLVYLLGVLRFGDPNTFVQAATWLLLVADLAFLGYTVGIILAHYKRGKKAEASHKERQAVSRQSAVETGSGGPAAPKADAAKAGLPGRAQKGMFRKAPAKPVPKSFQAAAARMKAHQAAKSAGAGPSDSGKVPEPERRESPDASPETPKGKPGKPGEADKDAAGEKAAEPGATVAKDKPSGSAATAAEEKPGAGDSPKKHPSPGKGG